MRAWRLVVAGAVVGAGGVGLTFTQPAHAAVSCVALAGGKNVCAGSYTQCYPGGCGEGHDDHTTAYVGSGSSDATGVDVDCPINFIQPLPSTGEASLLLNGQVIPLVPVPACSAL
jgi:hypothetical protein